MTNPTAVAGTAISRVLYGVDFSDPSASALPYALALARKFSATLFPVHVVSRGPLPANVPTQSCQALVAQAVREAHVSMERLEPRWEHLPHKARICCGDAGTELAKVAHDEKIDLIVLGTHGRSGVRKALLGSVAEKTLRHAPCPVLTVGPNVSGEPDRIANLHEILYATDLSGESPAALRYAVSLARENGARLYLLHVVHNSSSADHELLSNQLRSLIPPDAQLACAPKVYVEAGKPGETILQLAHELAADLIVLGAKRHSGLPGTMATAYQVVTKAVCPVLTVRG